MKIIQFFLIILNIISVILGIYVTTILDNFFLRLCGLAIAAFAMTNVIAIIDILRDDKR